MQSILIISLERYSATEPINQRLNDQLKNQVKRDQIENIVDKIPKTTHKEMPKSPSVNKEIER